MTHGKLRFGKVIWRTQQQDRSAPGTDPAHRIKLKAGTFVDYVGPRNAARIVVESHDAEALLAYRAAWCPRLVVGVSYGVPTPPPGVRVWVEKSADSRPPDSGASSPTLGSRRASAGP